LKYVVEEECRAKRENARLLRRQRANRPDMFEIETFPFHKQPKLDRRRVMSLYDSFDYITKQRDVIWLNSTGCGKTGLATAFLLQDGTGSPARGAAAPSTWQGTRAVGTQGNPSVLPRDEAVKKWNWLRARTA
jgi:hypothetical protein